MTGGSSYEVHVEHAAAAIAAGLCDVVISVYAATPRSDRKRARQGGGGGRRGGLGGPNPLIEWDLPYALRTPMGPYAWLPRVTCTSTAPRPSNWPRSP